MTRALRLASAVVLVATLIASQPDTAAAAPSPIHPDNRPSVVAGYQNGRLPANELLQVAPRCVTYHRSAPSLIAMIAAARRAGIRLVPAECYRDYAGQVAVREMWCQRGACHMAAVPGTSNHGWGKAVDFSDSAGASLDFDSPAYHWLKANAAWFGWNHPGVMEPTGPVPEAWHWEWVGDGGRMYPGTSFGYGNGIGLPLGGRPAGHLDSVSTTALDGWTAKARVAGWVIDPDTTSSVDTHVYVDGAIAGGLRANAPRGDVAELLAGYDASPHGFDGTIDALYGRREVCAYGINTGPGENTLLTCRIVAIGSHPIGSVDSAVAALGITVRGWALDADTTAPIGLHVYVNGRFAGAVDANRSRPDVDGVFPRNGTNHGFEFTLPAAHGSQTVCVYGINVGPGGHNLIGCRDVVGTRHPFGVVDSVSPSPGGLRVEGWAIDPDTTGPVEIHTYIDGRYAGATIANRDRPDVGNAFPGYGAAHGYAAAYPAGPGRHTVCTYGINVGEGATGLLECKQIQL